MKINRCWEKLVQGAIENPINGAVQLANHIAGAHLPELHIVDEQRLSHTAGGVLGNIAGTAVDIFAASVATAGIADAVGLGAAGTAGVVGAALRFGAVGAAYTTLLQPTDPNSKHFFEDRLTNGTVALGTFAAMGGAGSLLDSTGMFAVPAVRSLAGSLSYGGIVGTVGGIANAEGNALKSGQLVPKLSDLAKEAGSYAAFGMFFGGAGYAVNRIAAPPTQTIEASDSNVKVSLDSNGQPVKLQGYIPSKEVMSDQINFTSTKSTSGSWITNAWERWDDGKSGDKVEAPPINNVQIDGTKLTLTGGNEERILNGGYWFDDGKSSQQSPEIQGDLARARQSVENGGYMTRGNPVINVDAEGHATLTGGTSTRDYTYVNGKTIEPGQTVPVSPTDKVVMLVDTSAAERDHEERLLSWSKTPDGTQRLGTAVLKPGAKINLDSNGGGWTYFDRSKP